MCLWRMIVLVLCRICPTREKAIPSGIQSRKNACSPCRIFRGAENPARGKRFNNGAKERPATDCPATGRQKFKNMEVKSLW